MADLVKNYVAACVCVCVCYYNVPYHVNVASQYVTASGVTLLIRQNTEQGDTYDEIALKEYSMDALKAVISGKLDYKCYHRDTGIG